MHLYARQGDLVIDRLEKIEGELSPAQRIVFVGDSSGHPHVLEAKCKMRRDGRRVFVSLSQASEIVHKRAGGHKPVTLKKGNYLVRPLREGGDGSDRAVED